MGRPQPSSRRRWRVASLVVFFGLFAVGCIPSGTHPITSFGDGGVSQGLYRSLGKTADADTCVWSQGYPSQTPRGGGESTDGPVYMEIVNAFEVEISGCITFWKVPSPWDRPLATPGQPFGNGDFLVGYEVAPGVYRPSPSGTVCSWARMNTFHGHWFDKTIPPGGIPDDRNAWGTATGADTVTIASTDYGFSSTGCGQWTKVG